MSMLRGWINRLLGTLRRERSDHDLQEELRLHVEMAAEDARGEGDPPQNASRMARLRSGGVTQAMEALRDQRGLPWITDLVRDVRHGCRLLAKHRGSSLIAVLSLALAIGATATVFSLVHALFDRDLPAVKAPEALVALWTMDPDRPDAPNQKTLSLLQFEEIQRRNQAFSQTFAWRDALLRDVEAQGVRFLGNVNEVSGEYFSTLGVKPLLGRTLEARDVATIGVGRSARVAVLDYRCWERRFGSDPHVPGKTLTVDGTPLMIVGVMPKDFLGLNVAATPDAIVPIGFDSERIPDRAISGVFPSLNFYVAARLKPGITADRAAAHLVSIWPSILTTTVPPQQQAAERTRFLAKRINLEPLRTGTTGAWGLRRDLARPLTQLGALSALVLLVACVSLANLLLTRAAARRHELALRASLGARTFVLIRAMVIEGVLVSLAGAALGLVAAVWASPRLLQALLAYEPLKPLVLDPRPDLRVVGAGAAMALVIGVICTVVPAWRAMGSNPAAGLLQSSRLIRGRGGVFQKALICAQVSIALVLTTGALLFGRSLYNLTSVNTGFQPTGVLEMQMFSQAKQVIPNRTAYYREVAERLLALPGIESVSYVLPRLLLESRTRPVSRPGAPDPTEAVVSFVGPGFFHAMGMTVIAGRELDWTDDEDALPVAVVSQSLARHLFPGSGAIGQTVNAPGLPSEQELTIVGVVNNAQLWNLRTHEPKVVYAALMQVPQLNNFLIELRTTGDASAVIPVANRTLESLGYHYSIQTEPLGNTMKYVLREERLVSAVSVFFAALTILLAAAGLYGVLSYAVTLRRSEIGIRTALGARRGDILFMVLREAAWLVVLGAAVGVPVAMAAVRVASNILFGVTPYDPLTFGTSVGALAILMLCAAYIPAHRASRMDPLIALRME